MIRLDDINIKELFNKLDKLKINKEISGNDIRIVTSYNDRVLKSVNVSRIYEVFDFGPFAKKVVSKLVKDFNITKYGLSIRGGVQELLLEGDTINIGEHSFTKRFYILSSSDKTRRLQINFGLFNVNDFYTIISSQGQVSRKHTNGLNSSVDEQLYFDNKVFEDQIKLLTDIIGDTIKYSQVRRTILNLDSGSVSKTNLLKLQSFNNMLRYNRTQNFNLNDNRVLFTQPTETDYNDFEISSYVVFSTYLRLFRDKDSYIIKKETERISKITKRGFREERLSNLLKKLQK